MDLILSDASKKLCAEHLFNLVRRNYHEANKEYLQKQIAIASEYLTEEQKDELRQHGYLDATE